MVAKPGSNIHIIVGVMNNVEFPEYVYPVLCDMDQPASEKIERQERDNNRAEDICIQPVCQSKLFRLAPIAELYNKNGQQRMNEQVNPKFTAAWRTFVFL